VNQSEIKLEDLQIVSALVMEVFDQCAALLSVVNDFDGLLETNSNEDATHRVNYQGECADAQS
jgi:hypothetical protein